MNAVQLSLPYNLSSCHFNQRLLHRYGQRFFSNFQRYLKIFPGATMSKVPLDICCDIIDSHVHLDLIHHYHPHRISWLKEKRCGLVSWAYFSGIESTAQLTAALEAKARCIRQLSDSGLTCFYLAGIHPRSIPADLKLEQVADLLAPHLEDPLCLGIGEIGLETGEIFEKKVLTVQLEVGRRLVGSGKVIGVHTPRSNKAAICAATLALLGDFTDLTPQLVVDHCTPETIGAVLDAGFWAGVTLSPVKTSWPEMADIAHVHQQRIDRIMVNTDSGRDPYDDVVTYRNSRDLPYGWLQKMFYGNAVRFYGL